LHCHYRSNWNQCKDPGSINDGQPSAVRSSQLWRKPWKIPGGVELHRRAMPSTGSAWTCGAPSPLKITALSEGHCRPISGPAPDNFRIHPSSSAGTISALNRGEVRRTLRRPSSPACLQEIKYRRLSTRNYPSRLPRAKSWRVNISFVGKLVTVFDTGVQIVLQSAAGRVVGSEVQRGHTRRGQGRLVQQRRSQMVERCRIAISEGSGVKGHFNRAGTSTILSPGVW